MATADGVPRVNASPVNGSAADRPPPIRFTSHRDLARMWERGLRRSRLPVAWSEGFSPRPLLSFGLALPTGCESEAEYLDIRFESAVAPADQLPALLTPLLPDGLTVLRAAEVPVGSGSLQQEVTSCCWELEVLGLAGGELSTRIERLLTSPSTLVRRERKGQTVEEDIRPLVLALSMAPAVSPTEQAGTPIRVNLESATRPRGVRPSELVDGLGSDLVLVRGRRTKQWIERDGIRREPLSLGGPAPDANAPRTTQCAS
jgi:radical SAM-linked protein